MSTERKFKVEEHSSNLLSQLNRQRSEDQFCDVTLAVNGKKFPAHKSVLSACSDYFRTMFTTNMKEKQAKMVIINSIKPTAMQSVLDFLYTSDIILTEENVTQILEASSLMQIMKLLDVVIKYLSEVLNSGNCLYFRKLGRLHSLDKLVEEADQCILNHFEEVSTQPDFNDLEVNDVELLLASDKLMIKFEKTTFEAVLSWINNDLEKRKDLFPQLFRHVRLQQIPIKYLANNIRKEKLVREYQDCRDLVEDAFYFYVSPESFEPQQPRLGFIPDSDSVISFQQGSYTQFSTYKVDDQQWTNSQGSGQLLPLYDFAISSQDQTFVICGGRNQHSNPSTSVVEFNGKKWENLPAMKHARIGASAIYVQGKLFVFGGENAYHDNHVGYSNINYPSWCVNNFEVLMEQDATWEVEGNLNMSRAFAAAVAVKDEVYLFGGNGCDMNLTNHYGCKPVTNSTQIYNTSTKQWRDGPNMMQQRASFGAVLFNSKIYAFGGITAKGRALNSFEILNPTDGVWTLGTSNLPGAYAPVNACCVGNKIYVADESCRMFAEYGALSGQWISRDAQCYGKIAAIAWKTSLSMAN